MAVLFFFWTGCCHNTNFTLIHSLTPFCVYKQKLVMLYCKYTQHTLFTYSFYAFIRLFISVTVSSKNY